ncbi:major facilitator superfamily domain-containing protein [Aspergillus navahoensis]
MSNAWIVLMSLPSSAPPRPLPLPWFLLAPTSKIQKPQDSHFYWHMMSCVTLMFLMKYVLLSACTSTVNASNARLAGLQDDLNLSDAAWSAGISTFYVGYLVGQLPGYLLMAKSSPRWFLSSTMLKWSFGTICMLAMTNGAGFCILRFFIGLAEAPFLPALTLLTSSWYTKEESPVRIASNLVAMASFVFSPAWPQNTRFLSDEEREMAQYRVLLFDGGVDEAVGGTWDGLRDAVKDPFTWLFCLMHFSLVTAQSFKDFLPSIVKTFGFNTMTTIPHPSPSTARIDLAHRNPIIFSATGCSILISMLNVGARYFGLALLICGTYNGPQFAALMGKGSRPSVLLPDQPRAVSPYGGGFLIVMCTLVALSSFAVNWRGRSLNTTLDEDEGYKL